MKLRQRLDRMAYPLDLPPNPPNANSGEHNRQ